MEFMHEEERITCQNHFRRLVQKAAVTSCKPNIAQSVSLVALSSSCTVHIHRNIDLLFQQSRCESVAEGGQVPLPYNRAERTKAFKTFPGVLRDTCFDVST